MSNVASIETALRDGGSVVMNDAPAASRRVREVFCWEDPDPGVGIFNYLLLVTLDDGTDVCLCDDGTVRYVTDDGDIDQLTVGNWNHTLIEPPEPNYPSACPTCRGTGGGVYNDCRTCDGNGVV
jgi:hypothetical protein